MTIVKKLVSLERVWKAFQHTPPKGGSLPYVLYLHSRPGSRFLTAYFRPWPHLKDGFDPLPISKEMSLKSTFGPILSILTAENSPWPFDCSSFPPWPLDQSFDRGRGCKYRTYWSDPPLPPKIMHMPHLQSGEGTWLRQTTSVTRDLSLARATPVWKNRGLVTALHSTSSDRQNLDGRSPHENLTVGVVLIYTKLIKFCGHVVEVLEWRHWW